MEGCRTLYNQTPGAVASGRAQLLLCRVRGVLESFLDVNPHHDTCCAPITVPTQLQRQNLPYLSSSSQRTL